jgi:hypothetical protein
MAHFYATVTGSRDTTATKTGTKQSGMTAHIRGWEIGVRVCLTHSNGKDTVSVYRTSGSNGRQSEQLIAKFTEGE